MSNPRFYAGELDACTFTMSATEDASFPLSNLHSYVPADLWKSSATTSYQTLKVDLGSALYRDTIIVEGHNFPSLDPIDHIYLQYDTNDNSSFANPVNAVDIRTASGRTKFSFSPVTKRYWRLYFDNGGDVLEAKPEIGNLFICREVDAGFTYVYPYAEKNEGTPSTLRRSVSGFARSARTYGAITKWKITFDVMSDTFRTAWLRFHQKVIGQTPFYYYDCDDYGWYVFLANEVELETFGYQLNRTTVLEMESQSAGVNPL